MGERDKRVDAYIRKSAPFARPILEHLRDVVHSGAPSVAENIKWGMPSFELDGLFCSMAAFKAHVTFGFWNTAPFKSAMRRAGLGARDAMGHAGRIRSLDDLPGKRVLVALIREAAAIQAASPAKRPATKPRPALRTPADLAAALRAEPDAAAHFKAFSPGKRRDYIEWITEAKTAATRDKRLATALEWIAEGKSRNWKYEKC